MSTDFDTDPDISVDETDESSDDEMAGGNNSSTFSPPVVEHLSAKNVADLMNKTTSDVREIVLLPTTTLRLLLNFYKWDSHKMLEVKE